MKTIVGVFVALAIGFASDTKAWDKCSPERNVEVDTSSFSGYAGSLMESASVGRDSCKGADGLMHGDFSLIDAQGSAQYLFLPYKVTDNAEKLKGLVFPLEIYVAQEFSEWRGGGITSAMRLYVIGRAKKIKDSDGTMFGFYFPRTLNLKIDTDREEKLFKGDGGYSVNAPYGTISRMAVYLDDAALRPLADIKKCTMTIPFAPYRVDNKRIDLPPFTITVTLTKAGLANLQKFIKTVQKQSGAGKKDDGRTNEFRPPQRR